MATIKEIQKYRQVTRAKEIRAAAAKQGLEVPDRFPRAGDMVHMLFKNEKELGSDAVLRAVTVTNCDYSGRIYGWLWNDPANPMYVAGRDGRPVPAPPLLDVAGIPYDSQGGKPNHWSYMQGAIGPGDLPPLQEDLSGDVDEGTPDEGPGEGDNNPDPSPAA